MSTTVYGPITLNVNDAGWSNFSIVVSIPAAGLGAATGTQIRVTTEFVAWTAGGTLIGYVGKRAASGDAYDFAGTPSPLTWSGLSTLTSDGAAFTPVSDWVELPEAYDNTSDYLFAFYFSTVTTTLRATVTANGEKTFNKAGNSASTVDKSGFAAGNNRPTFVKTIEIRAATSTALPVWFPWWS